MTGKWRIRRCVIVPSAARTGVPGLTVIAGALIDDGEELDRRVGAGEQGQPDIAVGIGFGGAAPQKVVDQADKRGALRVVRKD